MAFLSKLTAVACKAETVPGTSMALADADNNVRIWDLAISSLDVQMDASPSKYATGDFGNGESIPGPQSAKITGTTKFWSDSPTEAAWTKLAKGCGCLTASGAGGWTLYPSKLAVSNSLTFGIYMLEGAAVPSGLHYDFNGCVGNCNIGVAGVGKPYEMKWEFTGGLDDINDITSASIPQLTLATYTIPDRFLNGSFTIGGVSGCISTMEFNFGNTVAPIECVGAETGYSQYIITEMNPTLTVNPLITRNTTYDPWNDLVTGTIKEIIIETADFKLTIPRAQVQSLGVGDRNGVGEYPITFSCLRPTTTGTYVFAPWELLIKA